MNIVLVTKDDSIFSYFAGLLSKEEGYTPLSLRDAGLSKIANRVSKRCGVNTYETLYLQCRAVLQALQNDARYSDSLIVVAGVHMCSERHATNSGTPDAELVVKSVACLLYPCGTRRYIECTISPSGGRWTHPLLPVLSETAKHIQNRGVQRKPPEPETEAT